MFSRGIDPEAVKQIVLRGEEIASYADDLPFPSCLVLGLIGSEPVHVVVARDPVSYLCIVVTVYRPDPKQWSEDFRTRRNRL